MKLLHPQEIEVFYFIPAIRKEFAIQLKRNGNDQREIAFILGVTEAAVSQYLNDKRASEIKLDSAIKDEISNSLNRLNNPFDSIRETQRILNFLRRTKLICKYHCKFMKFLPKNCDICNIARR